MNRPEINSFAVLESASFSAVSRGASPDTADSRVTNLLWSSGTNRGFIEGGPSGGWDCIDPVVPEAPIRRGIVRVAVACSQRGAADRCRALGRPFGQR